MKKCEYLLAQYAPGPASDLRLAIGLFLFEGGRLVRMRMAQNWRRVRCLDPRADVEFLAAIPEYFEALAAEHAAALPESFRDALLRASQRELGSIRISGPRGVETDDPANEFERLFQEHVEPASARRRSLSTSASRPGSRRWIHGQLLDGLRRHDLLDRVQRNVPVGEFTAPGDAFRIDFSYRPNGITSYLHAISLSHDWNQAKVLSYTFARIRQRQPAALIAVVADEHEPEAGNCGRILLAGGAVLQPVSGLDAFLKRMRAEL
jgi:hypothetical protein